MSELIFDIDAVESKSEYQPLPAGKYLAVATASEMKTTKSGTGQYLQVTFEVVEGEKKGRLIFERFNIKNENKTAQDIGAQNLKNFCVSVGVSKLTQSEQLHDIPVYLNLTIEPGRGEYGPTNRIKRFESANPMPSTQSSSTPKAESPKVINRTTGTTPPWKK